MNPLRISLLFILLVGGILTLLLVNNQTNQPIPPVRDQQAAESNAKLLSQQIDDKLAALQTGLESLSFDNFWQSNPVGEWSFWLETRKPIYKAAGLSQLGVHSRSNDVVYFDMPTLPGQYNQIKNPLQRAYQTKKAVSVLQMYKNEPAILIITPIKTVENKIIGSLIGVQYLNTQLLKQFHYSVKVPVAVVNNDSIETVSIDTSPALNDFNLVEVEWPNQIKSALWKLFLLVEPSPSFSRAMLYGLIGLVITLLGLFVIWRQFGKVSQSQKILNDTLDIDLPVTEQINRLTTLEQLTHDAVMAETINSIKTRIESVFQQKKELNLQVKKLQEAEKDLRSNVSSIKQERDSAFAAPKLKSEFLSRMGDEITTPMKSVVSMLKLLSEYDFEPEPKQLLNIAKRSTRTLVDNLHNILDFSKLDAGMLKLKQKSFSVRELVDGLSSELSHYANDKGLSLQSSTDPEVPSEVIGDDFRIKQVLRNLLGNAIRFTKDGEVTFYAETLEQNGEKMLRFTVKDTGVGIAVDAQKGLFDSLEQTTKLSNSSFAGRLRLIVSRHLAELMGGEIGVISEPGKGSQFWFTCKMETN